jgi:hypothetical protein
MEFKGAQIEFKEEGIEWKVKCEKEIERSKNRTRREVERSKKWS